LFDCEYPMTYLSFFGRVTFDPLAEDAAVAPPEPAAGELAEADPDEGADTAGAADDAADGAAADAADDVAAAGALAAALDVVELPPVAALVLQADTATSAAVPTAPQNARFFLCITTPSW
jgi:hypothetical protein